MNRCQSKKEVDDFVRKERSKKNHAIIDRELKKIDAAILECEERIRLDEIDNLKKNNPLLEYNK